MNELNTTQFGWHGQINQLFDQRSKEQYEAMAQIRKLEDEYYKMTSIISSKDKEIEKLKEELRDLDYNRPKYEHREKEVTEQLRKVQERLQEREAEHRDLINELKKMNVDMKSFPEQVKHYESQIKRASMSHKELQEKEKQPQDDHEIQRLRDTFKEVKQSNAILLGDIKSREQEIIRLKAQLDVASNSHRTIYQREEDIRNLQRKAKDLEHLYEEHKRSMNEKNSDVQELDLEVKLRKTQYENALKANALLVKKLVVLSQNERSDVNYSSEDDSDDELVKLRDTLSDRIKNVKLLFVDATGQQSFNHGSPVVASGSRGIDNHTHRGASPGRHSHRSRSRRH